MALPDDPDRGRPPMDCPHCHTENLIGAATCAGCGASLRSRPASIQPAIPIPSAAQESLPPDDDDGLITPVSVQALAPPPAAPEEVLCRVCTAPFQWRLGDAPVCPTCRQFAGSAAGDAGMAGAPAVGAMLRSIERPKPRAVHVPRRGGVSRGLVAILVGTVLVGSGFAVVRYVKPKSDAGGALVENVRNDSAKLVLAVPQSDVPRFGASLRLHTLRENSKLGFGMSAKLTDFHQAADQDVEISLVRNEPRGAVLDVLSSCRAGAQSGHIQDVRTPREIDIYPFAGHSKTLRIVVSPDAAPVQVDGTPAVTGRDVPPLLSIGSIGAGARVVSPGVRWKTEIELPVTTDRAAKHLVETFPADVTYVGRATYRGFVCAAFRILATAPRTLPEPLAAHFDKRHARIAGVVLFELETGLLAEGSLDVEQRFWKASGDEGEELKLKGRLELKRQ